MNEENLPPRPSLGQNFSGQGVPPNQTFGQPLDQQVIQPGYGMANGINQIPNNIVNGEQSGTNKNKKTIAIIAISVLCLIAVAAIVIFVNLLMSNQVVNNDDSSKREDKITAATFEEVEKYCSEHDIFYRVNMDDESEAKSISCQIEDYDGNYEGVLSISYIVYPYAIMTNDEARELFKGAKTEGFSVLAEGDDYLKMYGKSSLYGGLAEYIIVSQNTAIYLIASGVDVAEDALAEMGYLGWSRANADDEAKTGATEGQVSRLVESQYMTQRRNDLMRMTTAIVTYQTNHGSKFPEGPVYWDGVRLEDCDDGNAACLLVSNYISSSESKNDFVDPDGKPYGVYITENLSQNGSITTSFGNANSELVLDFETGGYTIGGRSPLDEHVIYFIPGSMCEGTTVLASKNVRNFSLLYQISKSQVYCIDDR